MRRHHAQELEGRGSGVRSRRRRRCSRRLLERFDIEHAAAPTAEKGPIVVGSKIDTEGKLLSAIILAKLENAGFKVDRQEPHRHHRRRAQGAAQQGDRHLSRVHRFGPDLLPGNQDAAGRTRSARTATRPTSPTTRRTAWSGSSRHARTTRGRSRSRRTSPTANNLKTMSDLAAYVKAGKPIKVAASDEFFNNADAWPAFATVYGFDIPKDSRVVLLGRRHRPDREGRRRRHQRRERRHGVRHRRRAVRARPRRARPTTRTRSSSTGPRRPSARRSLDKYPEIATELKPVFDALTLEKLQELNASHPGQRRVATGRRGGLPQVRRVPQVGPTTDTLEANRESDDARQPDRTRSGSPPRSSGSRSLLVLPFATVRRSRIATGVEHAAARGARPGCSPSRSSPLWLAVVVLSLREGGRGRAAARGLLGASIIIALVVLSGLGRQHARTAGRAVRPRLDRRRRVGLGDRRLLARARESTCSSGRRQRDGRAGRRAGARRYRGVAALGLPRRSRHHEGVRQRRRPLLGRDGQHRHLRGGLGEPRERRRRLPRHRSRSATSASSGRSSRP